MTVDLNLLPRDLKGVETKKSRVRIKIPQIAPNTLIITVISILLLGQGIISLLAITQRNRLLKLSTELKEMSPKGKVAIALKSEVDKLEGKLSVIESLTSGSLIWSKKLYHLSGAVVDGIWVTSLSLKMETPKGGSARPKRGAAKAAQPTTRQTLILQGSAVSPSPGEETAIVGKFIESLRGNKGFFVDFEDIKISSIQRRKLGELEVMDFTIVCYFKPGRRYFEKLEARGI